MLALVLGLSLLLSGYTGKRRPEYETSLFDTGRVHTVDVEISEDDWQDLLAHAEDKTKYETSVTIDGERTERDPCRRDGPADSLPPGGHRRDRSHPAGLFQPQGGRPGRLFINACTEIF